MSSFVMTHYLHIYYLFKVFPFVPFTIIHLELWANPWQTSFDESLNTSHKHLRSPPPLAPLHILPADPPTLLFSCVSCGSCCRWMVPGADRLCTQWFGELCSVSPTVSSLVFIARVNIPGKHSDNTMPAYVILSFKKCWRVVDEVKMYWLLY